VGKNKGQKREFLLRPRKPVARGERRVYASAYEIIMHHARVTGIRKHRVEGLAKPRRALDLTPSAARCGFCIQ
jgi:hypothetical protein